jgi:arylsulfatase A-like enzyme
MPTRFSLLTGRYAHAHGCWDNGILMPDNTVTLAQRFAEAGYRTALVGKGHLSPFRFKGGPESYDEWEKPDPCWASWHGPYFGFEEVHLTVGHHLPLGHYGMFLRRHHPEAIPCFQGERAESPGTGAPNSWKSTLPAELHPSAWVADRTIECIRKCGDKPFFIQASFPEPHPPFAPPEPYSGMYGLEDVVPPVRREGELEDKPPHFMDFYRGRLSSRWFEGDRASIDLSGVTDAQYREIVAHYYATVSLIDDSVGRVLEAVERLNLKGKTLVVFLSDHGELLGDRRLIGHGPFHYDSVLRVPLIFRLPGRIAANRDVSSLVSLIDVPATITRLTDLPELPDNQGIDLTPLLSGECDSLREHVFAEFNWRYLPDMPLKTIRTARWKLTYYAGKPYGELYDLVNDPKEFTNLYGAKKYGDMREKLKQILLDELILSEGRLPEQVAAH